MEKKCLLGRRECSDGVDLASTWHNRARVTARGTDQAVKLYTTLTSPYGRIARIVLLEKGLGDRIPVEVPRTREPESPYYQINPSGRVPYLALDDGSGIEESALICEYLDYLDGMPVLTAPSGPAGFPVRRLEARARSMLDGLSVWGRELAYRAPEIHSATILAHEMARAERMADLFEQLVGDELLSGSLNMAQITLAAALHGRDQRHGGFDWRAGRPALAAWVDRMGARDSVARTVPG